MLLKLAGAVADGQNYNLINMTFPLKIIGFLKTKVTQDYIQLTTDQTSLQTVGITLTFASGTLTADWGDGSSTENFVSGVELTHSYGSTAVYNIKISGDLTNITQFIADNNRITAISGLTTGLLTNFYIQNNLINGNVNLSNAPVNGVILSYGNSNFTGFTFATSGNGALSNFQSYSCSVVSFDFSNISVGGIFYANTMTSLTGITFASSGNNALTFFRINDTNMPPVDFANFPASNGVNMRCYNCNWTSTEHDNQLIYLYNKGWTGGILNIITGNAARTSASDTAYNWLIANGWSIF